MLSQRQIQWLPIFYSSLRRGATSKKFLYRNNLWYIKQHIKNRKANFLEQLKTKEPSPRNNATIYSDNSFSSIPLNKIKPVILKDIIETQQNGAGKFLFTFDRTDTLYGKLNKNENHWNSIENLLVNPIIKNVQLPGTNVENNLKTLPQFSYRYTINLPIEYSSTNTDNVSDHILKSIDILWPEPVYSNYVIGIGLNSSLFEMLNNNSSIIVHPITRKPLKLFEIHENEANADAIAICPKYNLKHRCIKGIDLITSIIPRKLCERNERETIIKLVKDGKNSETTFSLFNEKPLKVTQDKITNIELLISDSNKHKNLWGKFSDLDRNCPSDILRSVILSDNYELSQIREEFMKYYTLFNLFSFIWRYEPNLKSTTLSDGYAVKPWTSYIWNEYQTVDKMTLPVTTESLTAAKLKFDVFLQKLHKYYYFIISELKSNHSKLSTSDNSLSNKSLHSVMILKAILTQCKWFDIFYPNLYSFFQTRITPNSDNDINYNIPSLSIQESESINTLWSLMGTFIETESMLYKDKFPKDGKMLYESKQIDSSIWKMVILSKNNALSDELKDIIKYTLPIPIHFIKRLEKSKQFENYVCVKENMINEDLFVYVRKLENTPLINLTSFINSLKVNLNNQKLH